MGGAGGEVGVEGQGGRSGGVVRCEWWGRRVVEGEEDCGWRWREWVRGGGGAWLRTELWKSLVEVCGAGGLEEEGGVEKLRKEVRGGKWRRCCGGMEATPPSPTSLPPAQCWPDPA